MRTWLDVIDEASFLTNSYNERLNDLSLKVNILLNNTIKEVHTFLVNENYNGVQRDIFVESYLDIPDDFQKIFYVYMGKGVNRLLLEPSFYNLDMIEKKLFLMVPGHLVYFTKAQEISYDSTVENTPEANIDNLKRKIFFDCYDDFIELISVLLAEKLAFMKKDEFYLKIIDAKKKQLFRQKYDMIQTQKTYSPVKYLKESFYYGK